MAVILFTTVEDSSAQICGPCGPKTRGLHINKARWPSGPRRATQEISLLSFPETWDVFASRKGRGFESHSCHFLTIFFR